MYFKWLDRCKRFFCNEAGAVTSDWVVLTAGIVLAVWAGLLAIQGQAVASIEQVFTWVSEASL